MGYIRQHVCRGVSHQFPRGKAFQELLARGLKQGAKREVINEDVRVDKHDAVAGISARLKDIFDTESGSRAIRSTVSTSPFQPSNPAVARTRLTAVWTVMRTFSCSASGNGRSGSVRRFVSRRQ